MLPERSGKRLTEAKNSETFAGTPPDIDAFCKRSASEVMRSADASADTAPCADSLTSLRASSVSVLDFCCNSYILDCVSVCSLSRSSPRRSASLRILASIARTSARRPSMFACASGSAVRAVASAVVASAPALRTVGPIVSRETTAPVSADTASAVFLRRSIGACSAALPSAPSDAFICANFSGPMIAIRFVAASVLAAPESARTSSASASDALASFSLPLLRKAAASPANIPAATSGRPRLIAA